MFTMNRRTEKERERETFSPGLFWFRLVYGTGPSRGPSPYLGSFLPWKEQVGSTPVLVHSSSGSVPQKLDLDLTDKPGLQAELLDFIICFKKILNLEKVQLINYNKK